MDDTDKFFDEMILNDEMSGIRRYLHLVDAYLTGEQQNLSARTKAHAEKPSEETDHLVDSMLEEQHYELHGIFPTILSNSTLVNVCSFAEIKLRQLCIEDYEKRYVEQLTAAEKDDLSKKLKEPGGIVAYWKEHGIKLAGQGEWSKLHQVFEVRNQIVHTGGALDEHSRCEAIRKYVGIRERKGVHSVTIFENQIVVLNEYCEEALQLVKAMLLKQKSVIPETPIPRPVIKPPGFWARLVSLWKRCVRRVAKALGG
jgi:hypothetical protein